MYSSFPLACFNLHFTLCTFFSPSEAAENGGLVVKLRPLNSVSEMRNVLLCDATRRQQQLTCYATAKFHTVLPRIKSILISLAAAVVET